jgi:RNA polymerase sigma-70 factor, ECF subfamily
VSAKSSDGRYEEAVREFGRALDRLAAGYEADPDKRRDLRQEIHLQLWRSFEVYDGRCSLRTWTFRVAHNTAVSYVTRERRANQRFVALEEVERIAADPAGPPDLDRRRALHQLSRLMLTLKPLDRQILILYLEEMDGASIADITGLSAANVAMKIHRIKNILARRFQEVEGHA